MANFTIHELDLVPGIVVEASPNASPFLVRSRWATTPGGLQGGPAGVFFVHDATWVVGTAKQSVPQWWWESVRAGNRAVYVELDWRWDETDAWSPFDAHTFIVNHDPIADAGSHQVIEVSSTGSLLTDLKLTGIAHDQIDTNDPDNPALTSMKYRWVLIAAPPSAESAVYASASSPAPVAEPDFLSSGDQVPPSERGMYRFKLEVDDQESMTLGVRAGSTGRDVDETTVLIAGQDPFLHILSPTKAAPLIADFERGVELELHWRVGDQLLQDPAYGGAWGISMRIQRAVSSPIAPGAVGEVVFQEEIVSTSQGDFVVWDGRDSQGQPVVGAFDLVVEVLDTSMEPTGLANSTAIEERCIILDPFDWRAPLELDASDIRLSGSFMETGHDGYGATGIHAGIDMVQTSGPHPWVTAAKSGQVVEAAEAGVRTIRVRHETTETRYLHGRNLQVAVGDTVLQGQRLCQQSDAGAPGSVHLHFELHELVPHRIVNPLVVIPLRDDHVPQINEIFLRRARPPSQAASKSADKEGIQDMADLIVRCRDRAHAAPTNSTLHNGPYAVAVNEINLVGQWPTLEFHSFTESNRLREFYALQGHNKNGNINSHYLPYLRWDTRAYGKNESPITLDVVVADFSLKTQTRRVVIGPDVTVGFAAGAAVSAASPSPINVAIAIANRTNGLSDGPTQDRYHLELVNPPAGWTVMPPLTGPVSNGATQSFTAVLTPPAAPTIGSVTLRLAISSSVVRNIGITTTLNVQVTA